MTEKEAEGKVAGDVKQEDEEDDAGTEENKPVDKQNEYDAGAEADRVVDIENEDVDPGTEAEEEQDA